MTQRIPARHLVLAFVVVGALAAALVLAGIWSSDKQLPESAAAVSTAPQSGHAASGLVSGETSRAANTTSKDISPPVNHDLDARLRSHIDSLASAGGHGSRIVFTEGNRWGVDYVLRQMRRSTQQVRGDTFYVRRKSISQQSPLVNPMAIVPGASDTILVICAHIDASASRDAGWNSNWSRMRAPGADDDGTGIAAMLETLDFAAHSATKPRYTLMFVACNGEEKNPDYAGLSHADGHHLGSRYLAKELKGMGKPIKGVIAMDMVGWNPRENFMYIFATSRSAPIAHDLVERNTAMGLDLKLPAHFMPCDKSDNESFDRYGIPAILFMESCAPWRSDARHQRNPVYHSHGDTPTMITYPILIDVTKLVSAYVTAN